MLSAVNASLLQMSTPSLYPDPGAETNYLLRLLITKLDNTTLPFALEQPSQNKDPLAAATNWLVYSSLSCSILVAVGAMLAKEWLQNFDRTGRIGPHKEQVFRRHQKFKGVQQWQLERMVYLLPTLLLISVEFFWCGLIGFIFPVNQYVSGTVMALVTLGGIFYPLTTSAAVIWDTCPYQTLVSRVAAYWVRTIVTPSIGPLSQLLKRLMGPRALVNLSVLKTNRQDHEISLLSLQLARRLFETASGVEDQLVAIQNLISLGPDVCSPLIHDRNIFERMLSLSVHVIQTWQNKPSDETSFIATLCWVPETLQKLEHGEAEFFCSDSTQGGGTTSRGATFRLPRPLPIWFFDYISSQSGIRIRKE